MRNIKNICSISCFLLVLNTSFVSFAFAEEKVITLGGRGGWPELEKKDGIVVGKGKYGHDSMQLATNSRTVDKNTDLLINFEDGKVKDSVGNYKVEENKLIISKKAKMDSGAGLSRGNGGIRLSGKDGSMFGTTGIAGSILIEFWLNPSIAENGETVFTWRSSRTVDNTSLYQMINASFYKNHLEWSFTNVFNGYEKDNGTAKISSSSIIIPNVWTHHSISFDVDTGLLEYRINGKLESMLFLTTNGREVGGDIYVPFLGVKADIDICSDYTGLIDDFRIQKTSESLTAKEMRYDTYSRNGGRFETNPILVSQEAKLTKVNATVSTPSQTTVLLFVRSGDNYFSWTESEPEWIPVKSGEDVKNVSGLYFQLAAEMYPDGTGSVTPSVTQVDMHFKEVPAPLPPFKIHTESGDGEIRLTWSHSVDDQTGGYYVYYGDRPGEYLGHDSLLGESPLDVGNITDITFTGLKNGKIYYFAIAAYSKVDRKIVGVRSKEVYERPLKK